ncbi:hypothetical protein C0583_05640 [Candidatus Parcubacteria bacterium]|nr:MAG: hypothetical protein C0583_05640 [Candidatus Parcubacteria bacterium]
MENNNSYEEIKQLIEETKKQNEEILKLVKKNHSILNYQRILGYLKILIILIPLIIAYIYLPPMLEKLFEKYQEILSIGVSGPNLNLDSIDFDNLSPDILKKLTK